MEDNRYIIFEVLIENEVDGVLKYNATSLSDYMNGMSQEECWKQAEQFCEESGKKFNEKWTLCGHNIVTFK